MDSNSHSALLFPGQGSQFVGMGKSLVESEPIAKQAFQEADDVLDFRLSELCWNGPAEVLNDTFNTQPAILTHSIAVYRVIMDKIPAYSPSFTAGHSVGEFSALIASEAISFRDGLLLVRERGRLMREAGIESPGGMAAILGLPIQNVDDVLEGASERGETAVWVANDNCPGQVVISGEEASLNDIEERLSAAGAKKVVRLAVSIPSHSPLMAQAQDEFIRRLDVTPISDPRIPVVGNVHASILKSADEIREDLGDQLTSRVRWTDSMNLLTSMGVKTYFELGPGKVLTGLMRRIDRTNTIHAVDDPSSFSPLLAQAPSST